MASNKFKTIPITKPEDDQLVYHSNQHGQNWLDAKNRPIPLTQTLTGHLIPLTQSFCGIPGSPGRATILYLLLLGSAINSTAITQ